jgi:membrane protease YdiL (CAAX protease family)
MGKAGQSEAETSRHLPKRNIYALGVLAILGSEFLLRNVLLPKQANSLHVGAALIVEWLVLVVLLAFWIPRMEGLSLASIGWGRFKWRHVWLGLLAYLLATVALTISGFVLPAIGLESIRSLQPRLQAFGWPVLLGLFVTGTFLEEVFYRGYLIERLAVLLRRRWLAGLVSWLAFTLVHLKFFGVGPTIDVSFLSAALVLLYLKERSIWPSIILHGLNDAFAYLVFPLLMP